MRVHFSTSYVAQHIKKFQTIVTFESKVRIVFERISETVICPFILFADLCLFRSNFKAWTKGWERKVRSDICAQTQLSCGGKWHEQLFTKSINRKRRGRLGAAAVAALCSTPPLCHLYNNRLIPLYSSLSAQNMCIAQTYYSHCFPIIDECTFSSMTDIWLVQTLLCQSAGVSKLVFSTLEMS